MGYEQLDELTKKLGGIWQGRRRSEELVAQALTAKELFLVDKQYVIQEDKVVIVDDFTGRLMPDREWRDGLHQAVSAKEGLDIEPPKDTYARVSFQRFFRMYRKLSGMTGTGLEAAAEFWQIYHLPVVIIPTNEPCIRKQCEDQVFVTEQAKWNALVNKIKEVHSTDQPILVGTRSVKASETLSMLLEMNHLEHQVLNAVRHKEEASVVAEAGQKGKITVATNMAGRGTDIKLGRGVTELGGLYVIASDRHESGRIDRQLYGRSGRQGDPGIAESFVSLEDELPVRYSGGLNKMLKTKSLNTNDNIASKWSKKLFSYSQKRAEKMALRQRKGVLKTDDWLDEYLGFAGSE